MPKNRNSNLTSGQARGKIVKKRSFFTLEEFLSERNSSSREAGTEFFGFVR